MTTSSTQQAYKGYLLRYIHLSASWTISRDGQHIGWAPSLNAAKRSVDEVAG